MMSQKMQWLVIESPSWRDTASTHSRCHGAPRDPRRRTCSGGRRPRICSPMIAVRAALALSMVLLPAPQGAESPTQIVASVIRAVEHDSAAQVGAAWSERLRHDPRDRAALLALSVLGARTYDVQ